MKILHQPDEAFSHDEIREILIADLRKGRVTVSVQKQLYQIWLHDEDHMRVRYTPFNKAKFEFDTLAELHEIVAAYGIK